MPNKHDAYIQSHQEAYRDLLTALANHTKRPDLLPFIDDLVNATLQASEVQKTYALVKNNAVAKWLGGDTFKIRRQTVLTPALRERAHEYLRAFIHDTQHRNLYYKALRNELRIIEISGGQNGGENRMGHRAIRTDHLVWLHGEDSQAFKAVLTSHLERLEEAVQSGEDFLFDRVSKPNNLAAVAHLCVLRDIKEPVPIVKSIAHALYENRALDDDTRRRLRKSVNYFETTPTSSALYDGVSEQFFNPPDPGAIPVAAFEKTHSSTTLLGGGKTGEEIIRVVDGTALQAWIQAYESNTWSKTGLGYNPVEPILSMQGSYRIYADTEQAKQSQKQVSPRQIRGEETYAVYTEVLGPSVAEVLGIGRNELPRTFKYRAEFNQLRTLLLDALQKAGVRHGHPHWGNFCLSKKNKDVLQLYIIDFDLATKKKSWSEWLGLS